MTTRGRTWAIACAVAFGLGLALAGASQSASPDRQSRLHGRAAAAATSEVETQAAVCDRLPRTAVGDTGGPANLDRNTGTSECPKPQPPVNRTYGEDAYGSGPYGR